MISIPKNIDSKYRFVIIAALRSRQIQNGSRPNIEGTTAKPTEVAIQEVLSGLVEFEIADSTPS